MAIIPETKSFLAIDFETANNSRDSACAVGLVKVINGEITNCHFSLIRPPSSEFLFTYIHGISSADVVRALTFNEFLEENIELFLGVDYYVAHNAPFDRSVLNKCCEYYDFPNFNFPFYCTVQIARNVWSIKPTKLPNVCQHLGVPLDHHNAISDTVACAKIMLAALHRHDSSYSLKNVVVPEVTGNELSLNYLQRTKRTRSTITYIPAQPAPTYQPPIITKPTPELKVEEKAVEMKKKEGNGCAVLIFFGIVIIILIAIYHALSK